MRHDTPLTWPEINALHEQARERARELRAEAMDDFWRGLGNLLAGQRIAARRAAHRYAQRLERHLRGRSRVPVDCSPL